MEKAAEHGDWSPLHDLALIYLALSHGTDLDMAPSEQETMREKLRAWYPGTDGKRLNKIMEEAMLTYMGEHTQHMLDTSIVSLKNVLDKKKRIAVLNDLAELATADGTLEPAELSFIRQLAEYWEIERNIEHYD